MDFAEISSYFFDVSIDSYYYDAVNRAVSKEITAGTSATTFSPDATYTSGQTTTFLWKSLGEGK